jgi:hypothetical protein
MIEKDKVYFKECKNYNEKLPKINPNIYFSINSYYPNECECRGIFKD